MSNTFSWKFAAGDIRKNLCECDGKRAKFGDGSAHFGCTEIAKLSKRYIITEIGYKMTYIGYIMTWIFV